MVYINLKKENDTISTLNFIGGDYSSQNRINLHETLKEEDHRFNFTVHQRWASLIFFESANR